jgi:hypothetical protein
MTETSTETTAASNGTAPATDDAKPCEDCVTGGEKALAVLAALFGVFIIVMAFDMFSGGKVTGFVKDQVAE